MTTRLEKTAFTIAVDHCSSLRAYNLGMKISLLIALALLAVGSLMTFGGFGGAFGPLLMLLSLPPFFFGLFIGLLRQSGSGSKD